MFPTLDPDRDWPAPPFIKLAQSTHGPYFLEYLDWKIIHITEDLRLTDPGDIGTIGRLQGNLETLHDLNEVFLGDEIPEDEI